MKFAPWRARRERRALSTEEIEALLEAAATRPLRDALTIRRGRRKGQQAAKVSDAQRERLIRLGRERALIYKTLIYTGLRKSELASLTVSALRLDDQRAYVELAARNAKSGKAAQIPLRADLAANLREHLADRLSQYHERTLADGRSEYPDALPGNTRLFDLPSNFIRVFDRDLAAAGIAKTDAQGRTLDIHCLRHSFATMLSRADVPPRMAQELLRHSDIRLTMNTYTHLELLDTAGAVEKLPEIGQSVRQTEKPRQLKTGTYDGVYGAENGAVIGAERQENRGNCSQAVTSRRDRPTKTDTSKSPVNREEKQPLSSSDKGRHKAGEGTRTLNSQLGRLAL